MTTLVIEDVDDAVLTRLTRLAERNRVSLQHQVKALLEQSVSRWDRESLVDRAEMIAAMTPSDVPQTDSVALLREERDR